MKKSREDNLLMLEEIIINYFTKLLHPVTGKPMEETNTLTLGSVPKLSKKE